MIVIYLLILLLSLVRYGNAQQTFFPAAIPIAVRSPYLSCWQFTTNGSTVGSLWTTTSAHQPNSLQNPAEDSHNTAVLVRVDNITYLLLGRANAIVNATVNLTDTVISPTQTKLTAEAGPMQFNLTLLNPIEPGDWVKQSIPFSYLSLTARSLDGAAHAVQVLSYLSGDWMSWDRTQVITWATTTNNDVIYYLVRLRNQAVFNEITTEQEWGTMYFAMKNVGNITYDIADETDVRESFLRRGVLDNQTDTDFRAINDGWSVFGISRDLGTIRATQDPIVWTIGFTTDPAINYTDPSRTSQQRSLFYRSLYSNDTSLIVDFLNDFASATSRAQQLDLRILQDAANVSGNLGDLVSLATAQIYGSIQLTIGANAAGFDKSDVMAFMKNVGGSMPNRVNAVETLYSAFPAFMYIDPQLGGLLLEPLFRLQASPTYTSRYANSDLGVAYPNVTVGNPDHDQGVEHCGNMLIMTYAHARATGDGSFISRYYSLLTSWADYLSNSTLFIRDQSSADGLSTNNQTNLAIKGIIAIKAMSRMSSVVNQTADVDKYSNTAASLYGQWKVLALASDQHLLAAYGLRGSWTLGYNLFADMWLGTGVIESSIYNGQSSFIGNLTLMSTFSNFGVPLDSLDSDSNAAVSGWNLFAAAMTSNQDLRTNLISRVHNRASFNMSAGVFPLTYDSMSGTTISGRASPAQGAMYAPLALNVPVVKITANFTTTGTSSKSHTGAIAGGVTGGVAALLAIGIIALIVRHRRGQSHRRQSAGRTSSEDGINMNPHITVTPFDAMAPTLTGAASLDAGLHTERPQGLVYGPSPEGSPPQVPVGLSSKELALLRSRSQLEPTDASSHNSSPTVAIDRGGAIPPPQAGVQGLHWQSEVDILRREVEELRAERFEAPPSYVSGERPT